jgi:hypothetical protein
MGLVVPLRLVGGSNEERLGEGAESHGRVSCPPRVTRDRDVASGRVAGEEAIRRCSPRTHPKIVKLAVRDALESRKPRW